jgi:hypothetical protein
MTENPIVEEVHRIREAMLAQYGGDLHALVKDAQRQTEESFRAGRNVVAPSTPSEKKSHQSKKVG